MKKALLFSILLLGLQHSSAGQWVTIPDPNFVAWLNANGYSSCLNGNLMDTQCGPVLSANSIDCSNSFINDLSGIEYFTNLTHLDCSFNPIISIAAFPPNLEYFNCTNFPNFSLTDLPFSLPQKMRELIIDWNNVTFLPWPLPDSLRVLGCGSNPIYTLPLLPSQLEWLTCSSTNISSVPPLPATLRHLEAEYMSNLNQLPALPDTLYEFYIDNTPKLKCLPALTYIQEFRFNNSGFYCVPAYGTVLSSSPSLSSVPVCNLVVDTCAMSFNITGQIYIDVNNNCSLDTLEPLIPGVKVSLYQGTSLLEQNHSGINGIYTLNTSLGNYSYNINQPQFPFDVVCPPSGIHTSSFTPSDSMDTGKNFGLKCKANAVVEILSGTKLSGSFFPGDTVLYKVRAGDVAQSFTQTCASGVTGSLQIWIENSPAHFTGTFPSYSLLPSVSGDTLTYTISDFGATNIDSAFQFHITTDTSAVAGNQILLKAQIQTGTSIQIKNFIYPVVNSFDPNNKEVTPPDILIPSEDTLLYTINFQNTGSAPAQNIVITDTIDGDLQIPSFRLQDYSFRPYVSIIGNVIRFTFPDINLPDSTSNEPGSHGFVQYEMALKPNRPPGTQIRNTAHIFFDFNTPVTTNTTLNTVAVPTSLNEQSEASFSLFPNPASSTAQVQTEISDKYNLRVIDFTGRTIYHDQFQGNMYQLQVENWPKGLFVVELQDSQGNISRRPLMTGN